MKDLQRATGYSRSMVKYLKTGKRRPSAEDLPTIIAVAAYYARKRLAEMASDRPERDEDAVGLLAGLHGKEEVSKDAESANAEYHE